MENQMLTYNKQTCAIPIAGDSNWASVACINPCVSLWSICAFPISLLLDVFPSSFVGPGFRRFLVLGGSCLSVGATSMSFFVLGAPRGSSSSSVLFLVFRCFPVLIYDCLAVVLGSRSLRFFLFVLFVLYSLYTIPILYFCLFPVGVRLLLLVLAASLLGGSCLLSEETRTQTNNTKSAEF